MKNKDNRFLPKKNYAKDIDHQIVIKMYLQGYSCKHIAEKLNSYPKKIQKILKTNSIPFRKKKCYLSGPENPRYSGYKEIQGSFWASIKNSAKLRGIEFNIELKYVWDLFMKQNKRCKYTGIEIFFSRNNLEHRMGESTASLDRIDSSKGYVKGNVHWVHKRINIMKGNMSHQEFLDFCEAVTYKNKKQEIYKTFSHQDIVFNKQEK